MADLLQQLGVALRGRVAFVGIGNVERGDDGFGVVLLKKLAEAKSRGECNALLVFAGVSPEDAIVRLHNATLDNVIFFDAVEFGGEPGTAIFLGAEEIYARFPQISTHKISLGLLARMLESEGRTKAWLLGVQPRSLGPGLGLSPKLEASLEMLARLLLELYPTKAEVSA